MKMKQHITIDQLRELIFVDKNGKNSWEFIEYLRNWWKPKDGDKIWDESNHECVWYNGAYDEDSADKMHKHSKIVFGDNRYYKAYPLLSIGQMIEFLERQKEDKETDFMEDSVFSSRLEFQQKNGELYFSLDWEGELCDALWEAIKEVIVTLAKRSKASVS